MGGTWRGCGHGTESAFKRFGPSRIGDELTTMPRRTRQRDAIRHTFERVNRPIGPHECLQLARREVSALGIATVYRAIKSLLKEGWLRAVDTRPRSSLQGWLR